MAKKMVRPRPGALQQLLKKKGITQVDAANGGADRKTLRKVDRGEEIKLETLQKVAKKLLVPVAFFFDATPAGDEVNGPSDSMDTVMLRRLDAPGFLELFVDADRVEWLPNIRLMEAEMQKILQDLDGAGAEARNFYEDGTVSAWVRTADRLFKVMEGLKQRRLAVLGANYLFWTRSSERFEDLTSTQCPFTSHRYKPLRTALFSIEPSGTQSRRVQVSPGQEPPTSPPDINTIVCVEGPLHLDILPARLARLDPRVPRQYAKLSRDNDDGSKA